MNQKKKKNQQQKKEIPASLMFLEMLMEAGHVPQAVIMANEEEDKK